MPTPTLFVSEALREFPDTAGALSVACRDAGVDLHVLPGTSRNPWVRDHLPVVRTDGTLVQFRYWPDYLVRSRRYRRMLVEPLDLGPVLPGRTVLCSELIVDGGNVVLGKDFAVLTRKVFRENPHRRRSQVEDELRELLQVERLVWIPEDPYDFTGHADGLVAVLDGNTVLVPDLSRTDPALGKRLRRALRRGGLEPVPVTHAYTALGSADSAVGNYVNLVDLGTHLLVPQYGIPADAAAHERLAALHPRKVVTGIPCRALGRQGGAVHCATWGPVH